MMTVKKCTMGKEVVLRGRPPSVDGVKSDKKRGTMSWWFPQVGPPIFVPTCDSAKIKVTFSAFLWIFSDRIIVPATNIPHFKGLGMIDLQYEIRMHQKINNKSHNENINVKLLWFLLTHTLGWEKNQNR